jgi:hypothetical protein
MALDLSTPTAQLAFGVAQRSQEVQDYKARLEQEARDRVNARLTPYGNDLSQFDSTFKRIYDPVAATQQARAKAMQQYVTGLPELLARAKAERSSGSGGGGGAKPFVPQPYVSPEDFLNFLLGGQGGIKPGYADPYTPEMDAMRYRGPRPGTPVTPITQPLDPGYDWSKVKGWG